MQARKDVPQHAAEPVTASQQPQTEVLAGPLGGEALLELGRVVHLVPLSRSWWLSSGSVERRANGVAPKPGPSGSPSARGAKMSERILRSSRTLAAPACSPSKLVSQKGNATWLSLVVVVVVVVIVVIVVVVVVFVFVVVCVLLCVVVVCCCCSCSCSCSCCLGHDLMCVYDHSTPVTATVTETNWWQVSWESRLPATSPPPLPCQTQEKLLFSST